MIVVYKSTLAYKIQESLTQHALPRLSSTKVSIKKFGKDPVLFWNSYFHVRSRSNCGRGYQTIIE